MRFWRKITDINSIRKSKEGIVTKILKDKRGLSLTELLASIVVMLLVAAIMVVGVRLGTKAYVKSVSMSEAQILCSTLSTIVSDELRYAGTITVDGDGTVRFFSSNYGKADNVGLSFGSDEEGHVTLGNNRILSSRAYPYGLKASVDLTYDNAKFSSTIRIYSASDNELAVNSFDVKPINR